MKIASPLRAAVIGCGRIGATFSSSEPDSILNHVAACAASPLLDLVAVCDTNAEVAQAAAQRWQVPGCYRHVRDLLQAAQPQFVSICTPDTTHAAIASEVIAFPSVRGVLVEKPLASTVGDAKRTDSLAQERKIVLAVNYSRRWAGGIRELVPLLRERRLGSVQSVTGHYANGWIHNGTHWIDLARMLVGEFSAVRTLGKQGDGNDEDSSLAVGVEFECGAIGVVFGHRRQALSFFEMDIVCDKGRVRLSDGAEVICVDELRPSQNFESFVQYGRVTSSRAGIGKALLNAVEDVARCVKDGGTPACTGADGVTALRVAESARRSGGKRVEVQES